MIEKKKTVKFVLINFTSENEYQRNFGTIRRFYTSKLL